MPKCRAHDCNTRVDLDNMFCFSCLSRLAVIPNSPPLAKPYIPSRTESYMTRTFGEKPKPSIAEESYEPDFLAQCTVVIAESTFEALATLAAERNVSLDELLKRMTASYKAMVDALVVMDPVFGGDPTTKRSSWIK